MTPTDLVILGMATLYAAFALVKTHGPYGVFSWVREHVKLGGLTTCMVCAAFWFALIFYAVLQTDFRPIVYIFAASGLAVFAAQYTGMNQQ